MKDTVKPTLSLVANPADVPSGTTSAAEALRQVPQSKRALYKYLQEQFAAGKLKPGGRLVRKPKTPYT